MSAGSGCRLYVRSPPPELVQPGVIDSEMVGDLMDHGDSDFLHHLFWCGAYLAYFPPIDEDLIRQDTEVGVASLGQWDPLVEAEQSGFWWILGHGDDHVVQQSGQLARDGVERVADELLESRTG